MFVIKNERFLWFNGDSIECNVNYELIGMLLGLALYNQSIIKIDFPRVLYKKLLIFKGTNKQSDFSLEEIQEIEPEIYLTLKNLEQKEADSSMGLYFAINYESWGESVEFELISNGA